MKMTLAKLKVLAPLYVVATPAEKKELLKEYDISKVTFYAALKRYNMTISTTKTLS